VLGFQVRDAGVRRRDRADPRSRTLLRSITATRRPTSRRQTRELLRDAPTARPVCTTAAPASRSTSAHGRLHLHAEAAPPRRRQGPRPRDRPVLADHAAAAGRQGPLRRPALRRDGGLGAGSLRRRVHPAGAADRQERRRRRPDQDLRVDGQGREHPGARHAGQRSTCSATRSAVWAEHRAGEEDARLDGGKPARRTGAAGGPRPAPRRGRRRGRVARPAHPIHASAHGPGLCLSEGSVEMADSVLRSRRSTTTAAFDPPRLAGRHSRGRSAR
jgi:hypothetical protein